MHTDRPNRTTSTILSPGSSNSNNQSLSTSLSHRLRHNGSLRAGGGAVGRSPSMFSNKKSKGGSSGFDNLEPSSPKVTCIGEVRVKTKKQGMKMKMRACRSKSKRHSGGVTPQNSLGGLNNTQDRDLRNQGWVHLPGAICEAIRAFGNELSCLLPCKTSCFSSERGDNGGGFERKDGYSPCGVVCRWLVAMQDEEEEKGRRDVEIVVRNDEERVECSRRRSIFDDMEFKDEIFEVNNGGEVSGGRISICVPPKNALLLMRCRSDPMKISALTQKIWKAPLADFESEVEEEVEDDKVDCDEDMKMVCFESEKCVEIEEICDENGYDLDIFNEEEVDTEDGTHLMEEGEDKQVEECEEEGEEKIENGESEVDLVEETEDKADEEKTEESNQLSCFSSDSTVDESTVESPEENDHGNDQEMVKSIEEGEDKEVEEPLEHQSRQDIAHHEYDWKEQEQMKKPVLPDCLLLMMCEPKLSMEVSKETWVCSTDFIRWLPERYSSKKSVKIDGSDEPKKKKSGVAPPVHPVHPVQEVVHVPVQTGRSSISFPTGGGPVVDMIERKLVKPGGCGGGGGIEPFVLTRCKSAPMRSAVKNGVPELPCSLWRRESSRKIEPHRPSFGTTGVGF